VSARGDGCSPLGRGVDVPGLELGRGEPIRCSPLGSGESGESRWGLRASRAPSIPIGAPPSSNPPSLPDEELITLSSLFSSARGEPCSSFGRLARGEMCPPLGGGQSGESPDRSGLRDSGEP